MDEGRRGVEGLLAVSICLLQSLFHGSLFVLAQGPLHLHTIWHRESLRRTAEGCVPKGLCRWGKRECGGI